MSLTDPPHLAIVGATGLVGGELLDLLDERAVPRARLTLLASQRGIRRTVRGRDGEHPVEALSLERLAGVDVAFFCASGDVSRAFAEAAVAAGTMVIDNSSAFRIRDGVPLVVPEVNGAVLDELDGPALIANPNCSTIIALLAMTPIHRAAGVERAVVSTYQAASGGGRALMETLERQADVFRQGGAPVGEDETRRCLFNVFSHDSAVGDDGYNEEETKLVRETHKIWNDTAPRITATCVRVPVLRAHTESINLTLSSPLSEYDARALLANAPGVTVVDDRAANRFPEPLDAAGKDDVLVGRIRGDRSQPPGMGLELMVSGDQLRKGAALNAVQIAERLMRSHVTT